MCGIVKAVGGGADGRRGRWSGHREQRQQQFVQAALRVLAASGPDLLMDAVAAEAGVTKPVLYRYFSDKAALVAALGEVASQCLLDRLLPAIQEDAAGGRSPRQRVEDAVGAYFGVIEDYPNLYWLLARWTGAGYGTAPDSAAAGGAGGHKEFIAATLTPVISEYLRGLGVDAAAAEPWAYGITGLVQSSGEWWLQRRAMSRAEVTAHVTRLIWAALSGVTAAGSGQDDGRSDDQDR